MRSGSGSRGTRMVPVPVEVLGTVNTSVVTPPDQPVKLTYVARDAAGNTARVERTVEVYDPCMKAAGERRCPESGTCSVFGACDAHLVLSGATTTGSAFDSISSISSSSSSSSSSSTGNASSGSYSAAASAMLAGALLGSVEGITDAEWIFASTTLLPDTTPPTITLLGEGQLYETDTGVSGMIHTLFVGEAFVDPGATATDLIDTYPGAPKQRVALSPHLIVVTVMAPSGARVSAVRTDAPTPGTTVGNGADTSAAGVGGSMPYIISYDVADAAGNRARTVYRRVYVACRYPEFPCPLAGGDGGTSGSGATSCSVAGICGVGAAADLSLAPAVQFLNMSATSTVPSGGSAATLVPRLELLGASTVRVRAGALYDSCQGLGTEVCDPGANATSAAPGDLAGQVVACADRASAAGVAAPRPFVLVGLRYCGLDTRLPGRYKISFHLALGSSTEDSSGSSRSSELMSAAELVVYRTVLVEEECEAGEVRCDDGSCSTASGVCDDVLAGRLGAVAATTGVVITKVAGTAGVAGTNAATGAATSADQGIAVASSAGLMSALAAQLAHMATTGGGSGRGSNRSYTSPDAVQQTALPPLGGENRPPQLQLRNYPLAVMAGQPVVMRRGTAYLRCAAGQVPTLQLPCEPGAIAWDPEDGNITNMVALCPPNDCAPSQCRAHAVVAKQPADCGVDTTSAPVGATLRLRLAVFDTSGAMAAVDRVIRVVSPCGDEDSSAAEDTGTNMHVCDAPPTDVLITGSGGGGGGSSSNVNGYVCSQVPCSTLAGLYGVWSAAGGAATSGVSAGGGRKPRLFLLPFLHMQQPSAGSRYNSSGVNMSDPGTLSLGPRAEANQSLTLRYGELSPVNLAPCASMSSAFALPASSSATGAKVAAAGDGDGQLQAQQEEDARPCAAVANSTLEGDLTPYIVAHVEAVCSDNSGDGDDGSSSISTSGQAAITTATCSSSCSVEQLSSGACPPGTYRVLYQVESAGGTVGVAPTALQLLVAIEEARVTQLNDLTFVPWAEQLQPLQREAAAAEAAVATNRTAVELLASAIQQLGSSSAGDDGVIYMGALDGGSSSSHGMLRIVASMSAALSALGLLPNTVHQIRFGMGAAAGVDRNSAAAVLELGPTEQQRLGLMTASSNTTPVYALRVASVSVVTVSAAFRSSPLARLLPAAAADKRAATMAASPQHRRSTQQQAISSAFPACGVLAPTLPEAFNPATNTTTDLAASGGIAFLSTITSACITPPLGWAEYLAAQVAGAAEDMVRAAAQAAAAAETAAALAAEQSARFEGRDAEYERMIQHWANEATAAATAAEARAAAALEVVARILQAADVYDTSAAAMNSLMQVALRESTASARLVQQVTDYAAEGGVLPSTADDADSASLDAFLLCARLRTSGAAMFRFSVMAHGDGGKHRRELLQITQTQRQRQQYVASADERFHGYKVSSGRTGNAHSLWDVRDLERARHVGSSKNRVLAGLLLHQVRRTAQELNDLSHNSQAVLHDHGLPMLMCSRLTDSSLLLSSARPGCARQSTQQALEAAAPNASAGAAAGPAVSEVVSGGGLGGIGIDPLFGRKSGMFQPNLNASDYYNTSEGSPEMHADGIPYGFFHLPLPGADHLAPGYPVLLDVRLSAQRAAQALDYLSRGAYLSATLTKSLEAMLVFYSADAAVFGVWSASFRWIKSGAIEATYKLVTLPAISYGKALSRLDVITSTKRLLSDVVLLLLIICFCLLAGWDMHCTLAAQARLRHAWRHDRKHGRPNSRSSKVGGALSSTTAQEGSLGGVSSANNVLRLCYEAVICGLMAAAVGVFFTYAIHLSSKDSFTAGGNVYDADAFTPARYFLIKRQDTQQAPAATPGAAAFVGTNTTANTTANTTPGVVLYSFLQALVLALLLLRLLHALSFQPRLAVISRTLSCALPDLVHLFAVATVVVIMMAMALVLTSGGSRTEHLASGSAAIAWMYQLVLLADDQGVFKALLSSASILPSCDRVVTGMANVLSCLVFTTIIGRFVLALILGPFQGG
ncbi:hypothetical protein HYH02_007999 [Chlamydomonas schloesseri]|uniref:Polycystin cation channel PKD1/PKD2 domain-containing protein n=1 Tax=Chlamydomonas schloesseri TaxID=2026947 RepID=A0A835WHC3_9CHLO|nr:hypothetical protein HYH02_007999 [Chlamydomonas schloesseri]|eukprot:KAG2447259.1 hypothetical protein HYH02_007999 [Chlamydomonas schloesseri]